MLIGRFGPYDFKKQKLAANPYGPIAQLEREANVLLRQMIPNPDSPAGVILELIEQNDWPHMCFFAHFDQLFFHMDTDDIEDFKDVLESIFFNADEDPENVMTKLDAARLDYEKSLGRIHDAWEQLHIIRRAIKKGNMISLLRGLLRRLLTELKEQGKDIDSASQRDELTVVDIMKFNTKFFDYYRNLKKDGKFKKA